MEEKLNSNEALGIPIIDFNYIFSKSFKKIIDNDNVKFYPDLNSRGESIKLEKNKILLNIISPNDKENIICSFYLYIDPLMINNLISSNNILDKFDSKKYNEIKYKIIDEFINLIIANSFISSDCYFNYKIDEEVFVLYDYSFRIIAEYNNHKIILGRAGIGDFEAVRKSITDTYLEDLV
jgi:hypothetical protein